MRLGDLEHLLWMAKLGGRGWRRRAVSGGSSSWRSGGRSAVSYSSEKRIGRAKQPGAAGRAVSAPSRP